MITFKEYRQQLHEALTKIPNTQYGSNYGGMHHDSVTGEKHYLKYPETPEQAHVEVATAKIYNKLGLHTVSPEIHNDSGVISKWNNNLKSLSRSDFSELDKNPKHAETLVLMHHAAIMTGNRDIVGLDYGNIMHDKVNDRLVSVDQGGAMNKRAMGGTKPFDKDIDDLESFQNPRYTVQHAFGDVAKHHPEAFKKAKQKLAALSDSDIDSVLGQHDLTKHSDTIKWRRDALVKAK
jgi:hypothetical protein